MKSKSATIRELRTDFRGVKRKIEEHGEIVITDRGEPAYLIRSVPQVARKIETLPDYYVRLRQRQPLALSPEQTRSFWEQERR